MAEAGEVRDEAERLIGAFCGTDNGRSVAVCAPHAGLDFAGRRADELRPAASIMKVPLVMALYNKALAGGVSLDMPVRLSELGATRYASVMAAFDKGRSLSVRELAALALLVSDNPATVRIMEIVGFDDVSEVLSRCGCTPGAQMRAGFTEDELGAANRVNQLSAADCIRIFGVLRRERHYAPIVRALENNLRNNRIPAMLPDDVVVAHKTGSLEGVVNNAGVLSYGGRSFTLAVLTDGQSDPIVTSQEIGALALGLSHLLLGLSEVA